MSHRSTRCCSRSRSPIVHLKRHYQALEPDAALRMAQHCSCLLRRVDLVGNPNTAATTVELKLIRFQNGAQIDVDHYEIFQMEDDIITKIYFK